MPCAWAFILENLPLFLGFRGQFGGGVVLQGLGRYSEIFPRTTVGFLSVVPIGA